MSYFVGVRHHEDGLESGTFLDTYPAARRRFCSELTSRGIEPPAKVSKRRTEVPLDSQHSFVLVEGH